LCNYIQHVMSNRIALFASGSGSNVENIIKCLSVGEKFVFPVIVSNKQDAFVHERAKILQIPSVTFSREDFLKGGPILELLRKMEIEYLVLAGFLLKVPDVLIAEFPGKIINIHPALLPKYGGKGMYGHFVHEAVAAAGETESGITIHYIDSNYDEGGIVFQAKCPVLSTDTPEMIAEKVHALEYEYYPRIIDELWG
jgi:phosphoribosylglycinamide formyltransferase 1